MKQPLIVKKIFILVTSCIVFLTSMLFLYQHLAFVIPNNVTATVIDKKITPKIEDELMSAEGEFSEEKYQTEVYKLELKLQYKIQEQEYKSIYTEEFETSTRLKWFLEDAIDEDGKVNIFVDKEDKTKVLKVYRSVVEVSLATGKGFLIFLLTVCVLYWSLYPLFRRKNVFIYDDEGAELSWKPFYIRRNALTLKARIQKDDLVIRSVYEKMIILIILPYLIFGLFGFVELFKGDDFPLVVFFLMMGGVFLVFFHIRPLKISKRKQTIWRGWLSCNKVNTIALLNDVKSIQFINVCQNPIIHSQVVLVKSDNSRTLICSVRNGREVAQKIAEYIGVPLITTVDSIKSKVPEGLSWDIIRNSTMNFDVLKRTSSTLVLVENNLTKYLKVFSIVFLMLYAWYVLYCYPSEANVACLIMIVLCSPCLYPFFRSSFTQTFDLLGSYYYQRSYFNPFKHTKVRFDDIAGFQLTCAIGVKDTPSLLQLNLVIKNAERVNLLDTISCEKALRLAKELAKELNKPLFIDPIIEAYQV